MAPKTQKTVVATIIIRGNPSLGCVGQYEPRTVYQHMTPEAYMDLVRSSGVKRIDNTAGFPMLINMEEVASLTCGPVFDE